MPPIPASATSKSKLKAFQFNEPPVEIEEDNPASTIRDNYKEAAKEDHIPPEDQFNMAASQLMPGPQPLSQRSQHKECPQTPVGRLPLAELIAAVDDNANRTFDLTPGERVLWQHVPGSSQLSTSQPAKTNKQRRKRARSSSPPSSSQNETSNHLSNKKQSLDLETLQKTLKTPQTDPAADLWTRYSLKIGGVRDGSPIRNETFTEFLRSSSPQTQGSHLKTRELKGLKRSISCANEWPMSAAKRRKLDYGPSHEKASNYPVPEKSESAKMSRVNLLVEQVQNALLRSRTENVKTEQNLESSPSPDKGVATDQSQSSPTRGTQTHSDQEQEAQDSRQPSIVAAPAQIEQDKHAEVADKVSEFEDDDFDDDELLEAVDASLAPKPLIDAANGQIEQNAVSGQMPGKQSPRKSKPSNKQPLKDEQTTSQYGSRQSQSFTGNPLQSERPRNPPVAHDDYDDDDDDMSAADLEDLVAIYDKKREDIPKQSHQKLIPQGHIRKPLAELSQPTGAITKKEPHTAQGKANIIDVSSDEEFGEDADFDDLVAQCPAATQTSSQRLSVRTR